MKKKKITPFVVRPPRKDSPYFRDTYDELQRRYREQGKQKLLAKLRFKTLVRPVIAEEMTPTKISRLYGVSRRIISKYLEAYRRGGEDALQDQGKAGRPRLAEKVVAKIKELKLAKRARSYEKIRDELVELYGDVDGKVSRSAFYSIVKELPPVAKKKAKK